MSLNALANAAENYTDDIPIKGSVESKPRDTGTMKALVWHGSKNVSVEEVPIPTITEADDVVCKVTGTTVCGSDLHLYHKEILELRDGDILGHEWCGVVVETGPNVKSFKRGDRVVSSFQVACGECDYCKQGMTSMCNNTNPSKVQEMMYGDRFSGIYGYSHFAGGYSGGQAEFVRAPHADHNLLKIPGDVTDEQALYLSDIIPTSYHSVECANVKEGDNVAIWGLGPIGLCAAKWCSLRKANKIYGIDNNPERLAKASEIGFTPINFDEKDVYEEIRKEVPQGLDCAIDCAAFRYAKSFLHKAERALGLETDSSDVINEQIRCVKKQGTISLIADYVGYTNHFLIGAVMEKGITLRGCGQAPVQHYWHKLMEKVSSGEFDPRFIVTHRFAIDDFAEIYKSFDEKDDAILKPFVETRFSHPADPKTPALSKPKC